MSDSQKLTKKQRKSLAFRHKVNKKKSRPDPPDLPEADDVEQNEEEGADDVKQKEKVLGKRKRAEAAVGGERDDEPPAYKPAKKSKSKAKVNQKDPVSKEKGVELAEEGDENTPPATSKSSTSQKSRYILFVGNLKYTTTQSAILSHFSSCSPTPPTVRLLTPKPKSPSNPTSTKSKGCAFVEFSNPAALQKALALHHSILDERKINVELTAGGGGKSETRLGKVRERNRALGEERVKRSAKRKIKPDMSNTGDVMEDESGAGARHSSTSGSVVQPSKKRTWTVPEEGDEAGTHRGGVKHSKEKKRGAKKGKGKGTGKDLGTGVNAIPVG